MRTALAALSLLTIVAFGAAPARAQEASVRFPVVGATDTTFTFRIGQERWVRPGLQGMVVDPREQDMLVARFRVAGVTGSTARAVVTGQTTNVTTAHMVVLEAPAIPWYKRSVFWLGAGIGAAVGFLLGQL